MALCDSGDSGGDSGGPISARVGSGDRDDPRDSGADVPVLYPRPSRNHIPESPELDGFATTRAATQADRQPSRLRTRRVLPDGPAHAGEFTPQFEDFLPLETWELWSQPR